MTLRFRGFHLASYRYPAIEATFSSSMHSWENLHFVGGWTWCDNPSDNSETTWTDEGLVSQVLNRKKPIGFAIPREAGDLDRWQARANAEGCAYRVLPKPRAPLGVVLGVAVPGKVGRVFDLAAVTHDYLAYLTAINVSRDAIERIVLGLEDLRSRDLSDFLDPS